MKNYIYTTEFFRNRFERDARENIKKELNKLGVNKWTR
jgi:predicted metal-dependent HD superfamily phosphohydrolase